jgi:tRNA(His) 5'-end guanylyltransferase
MSDDIGDRMKSYENVTRNYLTRRIPMIIRIDGKAFHTFARGFMKPFDYVLMQSMWETTQYLCKNVEGCKIGYTQSDEISLLITDYMDIKTQSWFDKNIQKMVSVSASMATLAFNNSFRKSEMPWHEKSIDKALFDSRCFVIPKEEVCNYFIWRQQDATRNAIQMVGQANFSQKQLHGKNCSQIQEMLFSDKSINFNDLPVCEKRGVCIVKEEFTKDNAIRTRWVVDEGIPIFTQDRSYIEKYL